MIRTSKYLFALALLAAGGCSTEPREKIPTGPEAGTIPIVWDVVSVDKPGTQSRSLIGPAPEEGQNPDWITLEEACTPTASGGQGEAIGIWADYTYMDTDGQESTMKDVFRGTRLIYQHKESGNPHSNWNYAGSDLYWFIGGRYKFRAYYPQNLADHVVSSTNATTFVIEYPTHEIQEDLLLAYNQVNTNNPLVNLNDPVPLHFSHGLAALRFFVKASYTNSDQLTSCYLQNADSRDFATSGMLAYGTETQPENISWIIGYTPPVTERIYYWSHPGVAFSTDEAGNTVRAMAYTAENATSGDLFTQNNGWVLILPQASSGNLQFCFTTTNGEEAIYRVTIPKITERITASDGSVYESTEYRPGRRYTYTITITETNVDLTLTVADWNERESSYEIVF